MMQLFIEPPPTPQGARVLRGVPHNATVGHLRRLLIKPENVTDDNTKNVSTGLYQEVRLTYKGRPLLNDDARLSDEGIGHNSTVRTSLRLRGGSMIKLTVHTTFGCTCVPKCFCSTCRSGRVYSIEVNNIDSGSALHTAVAAQNALYKDAKYKGFFTTKKGVLIETDRKLIVYDLEDGDAIDFKLLPCYWFKKDYRGLSLKHTLQDDDDEDEEYKAALEKLRQEREETKAKEKPTA